MAIETMDEWNRRLSACGCCNMPVCAGIAWIFENKNASGYAFYKNYDFAVRKWDYQLAEWLAEDPEREAEDYPIPYPVKPDPALPPGTSSLLRESGASLPFSQPDGMPTDEIPTLYRQISMGLDPVSGSSAKSGVLKIKQNVSSDNFSLSTLVTVNFDETGETGGRVTNMHDPDSDSCTSSTGGMGILPNFDWEILDNELECTESSKSYNSINREWKEGTDLTVDSCPGPFSPSYEIYANVTEKRQVTIKSSEPVSKSQLIDSVADMLTWKKWISSGISRSELTSLWPKIGEVSWPGCAPNASLPDSINLLAQVSIIKTRYRFRVSISHEGNYYKITWDVVFFPRGWDTLPATPERPKPSFFQEDLTVEWHGPGTPIPNPDYDDDGEITNQAAIDAALETWMTPWRDLPVPETEGRLELRNIRYICYNSPYGTLPQTTGEAWEPAES